MREGVKGDSSQGDKIIHSSWAEAETVPHYDGGWEFWINTRWERDLFEKKKKKTPACFFSLTSYTLCTTRVAKRGLSWAEELIIRMSEMNSIFKQRKKILSCSPEVTKPHFSFFPSSERSHLFSLK